MIAKTTRFLLNRAWGKRATTRALEWKHRNERPLPQARRSLARSHGRLDSCYLRARAIRVPCLPPFSGDRVKAPESSGRYMHSEEER